MALVDRVTLSFRLSWEAYVGSMSMGKRAISSKEDE